MIKANDWRRKDMPESFQDFIEDAAPQLAPAEFEKVFKETFRLSVSDDVPDPPPEVISALYKKTLYCLKVKLALEPFKKRSASTEWGTFKKSIIKLQREYKKFEARLKAWLKEQRCPNTSRKLYSRMTRPQLHEIQMLIRLLENDEGVLKVYSKMPPESHLILHLNDYLSRKLPRGTRADDRLSAIAACLVAGGLASADDKITEHSTLRGRLDRAKVAHKREALKWGWGSEELDG